MGGWYKQQRNVFERMWSKDACMVQLYFLLKERAYVADGQYEGVLIRRGSCPITRSEMAEMTGMSARTIDRVLRRLISHNEIIVKANNRFSVITICDYDSCGNTEVLFGTTDGIAAGTTDGITDGIAAGTTHLLKKEERYKDILITPYSPYKKEREEGDVVLEVKKRYNKTFDGKLQPCIRLTMPTRISVQECIRRFGLQAIDLVFEQVLAEPFSLGQNNTGFIASFQYIFQPKNFQQYLERAQLRIKKKQTPQPQQSVGNISMEPIPSTRQSREEYEADMREYAKNHPDSHAAKIVAQWDASARITI